MSHRNWLLSGTALVWTDENRPRYDRRGQRYPSDLTNEEWAVLEPLLPVAAGQGRPRTHVLREVMNGIRYVQRYGVPWDAMPKDLPPGCICYDYWRLLTDGGHLDQINHVLVMADGNRQGGKPVPRWPLWTRSRSNATPPRASGGMTPPRRCWDANAMLPWTWTGACLRSA